MWRRCWPCWRWAVALAATIEGTNGNDRIVGSDGRDQIAGKGGHDTIYGLRVRDSLSGGSGNDTIYAGPVNEAARDAVAGGYGDDVIRVANRPAEQDVVDCGPASTGSSWIAATSLAAVTG